MNVVGAQLVAVSAISILFSTVRNKTLFWTRKLCTSMTDELDLGHGDYISQVLIDMVNSFYSNIESSWSREIPKEFQDSGYIPDRLVVSSGYQDVLNLNISLYKDVDSSKFFLGVTASADAYGDVTVESYLVEASKGDIVSVHEEESGKPEMQTLSEETLSAENKSIEKITSQTLNLIKKHCDQYQDKNVKQLLIESS